MILLVLFLAWWVWVGWYSKKALMLYLMLEIAILKFEKFIFLHKESRKRNNFVLRRDRREKQEGWK